MHGHGARSEVKMDEPTTYLDMSHQVELMNLMQQMNAQGKTVVVVLHDLNQARRYCDYLIVLEQGQLVAQGSPDEVLTDLAMRFLPKSENLDDPISNTPMCVAI